MSLYIEPTKCSAELRTGVACSFVAKYEIPVDSSISDAKYQYFCGTHSKKRDATYRFRQNKVCVNECRAFYHAEKCKEIASDNANQGKVGDITITNHVRGEIPQHKPGYHAVFVRYGKSKVGWNLSSLDPLKLTNIDIGMDYLSLAKNLQLVPLAASCKVGSDSLRHILDMEDIYAGKAASSKKITLGQLSISGDQTYRFYDENLEAVDLLCTDMRAVYAKLYAQAVEGNADLEKLRKAYKDGCNIQIMGAPGTGRFWFPEDDFTWATVLMFLIKEPTVYPWDLHYVIYRERLEIFSHLWK